MTPVRHIGRKAPRARGAALLTAMVSVAVLTALAVDLAYQSRVSLNIAANARDELRAHYRARSGVTLGRLLLSFQQDLDKSGGQTSPIPRVQLWNLVAVDQSLADGLFGGAPAAGPSLFAEQEQKPAPTGPTFDAVIENEALKVNAQFFATNSGTSASILRQRVQSVYQLICDSRWDPLFEREDANGLRSTREDVLVRVRDWVNDENYSSALRAGPGSTSGPCGLSLAVPPFEKAFGDRNQPYDRGEDRYRVKGNPMDSLDELYLVAGIGDAFMAAFGDSLTVYFRDGDKQDVNVLDKDMLLTLAGSVASPPNQPALSDPEFGDRLAKLVRERTLNGMLAITSKDMRDLISSAGVTVNESLLTSQTGPFTDRSKVFRLRASGTVGAVRSSIDAVVRFDDQNQKRSGDQLAAPGQVIHWRED